MPARSYNCATQPYRILSRLAGDREIILFYYEGVWLFSDRFPTTKILGSRLLQKGVSNAPVSYSSEETDVDSKVGRRSSLDAALKQRTRLVITHRVPLLKASNMPQRQRRYGGRNIMMKRLRPKRKISAAYVSFTHRCRTAEFYV